MSSSDIKAFAQWTGIAMPLLYAGITFQYSQTLTLLSTTPSSPNYPPKTLATHWLRLYQQGPRWVPPLIHSGFLANLYLSWISPHKSTRVPYALAALLTLAILPVTFLYFEPGVNGACKWKVQMLLREDGFSMLESYPQPSTESSGGGKKKEVRWNASVVRHSATEEAKAWAERAEMGELVMAWAKRNYARFAVAVAAAGLSGWASLRR